MQERIPQSIAKRVVFKAFLAADHVTAAGEGLTIPVQISKNGGTFANLATPANASHIDPHGCGWYYIQLAIADTDTLGPLIVRGTEATIDPVELICEVVAPTNAGFTALPAVVAGAIGGLSLQATTGTVQTDAAAALTAYNTTGVAKEASVGAIQTILAGITSLAAWLRGMFRKDAINAAALGEINAIHDGGSAGTFSATTDSNEAIADKAGTITNISVDINPYTVET